MPPWTTSGRGAPQPPSPRHWPEHGVGNGHGVSPMAAHPNRSGSGVDAVARTVPAAGDVAAALAVLTLLLGVGHLDARVVELDLLGGQVVARVMHGVRAATATVLGEARHALHLGGGDDDVYHLHLEVAHLLATGAVDLQGDLLDVLAAAAGLEQLRRRLVDELLDGELAEVDALGRGATGGAGGSGGRLAGAELEAQQLDPVGVIGVQALTGDAVDLEICIECHD